MVDKATILIVDDEDTQRRAIGGFLQKQGFEIIERGSGEDALNEIESKPIDLVITDIKMPGISGMELMQKAREIVPDIAFIIMTAYGSVDSAVEAMRQGAFNYLTKPIDLDELEINISKVMYNRRLIVENRRLKNLLKSAGSMDGIISVSNEMQEVLNLVARVAESTATVLIHGESGTGKERIARALHYGSSRADKPMISVNCAAIPETLLESELFGHEAGAFTGASKTRKGKIEAADQGTLFIDEIGDMPLVLQPKLLRFIQENTIERLGSNDNIKIDIRLIAATHRDLSSLVKENKFREDFYYRLNVIVINIPPLRDRKVDIIPLAEHFIKIFSAKNSKNVTGLTRKAKDMLLKYEYPGNVRELENAIEAAVVLTRNEAIDIDDLPLAFDSGKSSVKIDDSEPLPDKLEKFEKNIVMETLRKTGGNKSRAARLLGISEKNIRDRLNKWGISG